MPTKPLDQLDEQGESRPIEQQPREGSDLASIAANTKAMAIINDDDYKKGGVGGVGAAAKFIKETIKAEPGIKFSHDIAKRLIDYVCSGVPLYASVVAENLENFEGVNNQETAEELIERGQQRLVAGKLEQFVGLNYQEIADKFIAKHFGGFLVENLEKFQGLNHQEIAEKLIDGYPINGSHYSDGNFVASRLEKFQGLNYQRIAEKLIAAGFGLQVMQELEKFKGLDYQVIANQLIEKRCGHSLVWKLEQFEGVNNQEIMYKLIAAGEGKWVLRDLGKFGVVDYSALALAFFNAGDYKNLKDCSYLVPDLKQRKEVETLYRLALLENPGNLEK